MPRGGAHKHKGCEGKGCDGCKGTGKAPTGPKAKLQVAPIGDKGFAARVLDRVGELGLKNWKKEPILNDEDYQLNLLSDPWKGGAEQFNRLREKRDGKAPQTINYMHDKPLEMNVTLKLSEIIRQVRERKREYERNRG